MRIAVLGAGLVGQRAAVFLRDLGSEVTLCSRDRPVAPIDGVETITGFDPATVTADLAILATESMHQVQVAERLVRRGMAVVSTADRPLAVRTLWTLDALAEEHGAPVVVGAGCAPGLSTLMVAKLAEGFEQVDAITTARFGTGGPTCAREHHRSMAAGAWEVNDTTGRWARGGSGRTLVWFPEPAGPQDCYRAGLSEPFLLQQAFPHARRIQSVQAATRRDRATARLPMLRPPHAEGLVGAVWVEVRGTTTEGAVDHRVMAARAPQATAAAVISALVGHDLVNRTSTFQGTRSVLWSNDAPNLLRRLPDDVTLWAHTSETGGSPVSKGPVQAARKWRFGRGFSQNRPNQSLTLG